MKFLVFIPPFHGHANVLLAMARQHPEIDFEFIITGWSNILPNFGIHATLVDAELLDQTDPALWTLPRVVETLGECLRLTEESKPDVILYDFFSLEGRLVANALKIPAWCSIPAFLGPADDRRYIDAKLARPKNRECLRQINKTLGSSIKPSDFEPISDGFYLPGDIDLVWSYPAVTSPTHALGRANTPRVFVGSPVPPREAVPTSETIVLLSFGTVVMGNLWHQQESLRHKLQALVAELADSWATKHFKVRFVTQGRHVLDSYPSNWIVEERIDQAEALNEAAVFVTHGGSNSFHEALVRRMPMVALPFFGDQPLVAQRIEELGLGFNLQTATSIDTKDASEVFYPGLDRRIDRAVQLLLHDPTPFQEAYDRLHLKASPLGPLLAGRIPFEEGDLLYGTNPARKAYVEEINGQEEFHLLKFLPFSQIAPRSDALPRIVDIYHDAICDPKFYEQEIASEFRPYADHIRAYHDFLEGERDITQMCLRGLDFFSHRYHIHFLLEVYDPMISVITTKEIQYILEYRMLFESHVTFYKKAAGTWIPVSFEDVEKITLRK